MSKTKKTKSDNTQYYKDKKEINDFLFHRKKEAIRILNRKVPFIIWTKNKNVIEQIDTPTGMIDAFPILSNLFGIEVNEFRLGNDILGNNINDNTVVFTDGSYLTSKIYYNGQNGEIYSINGGVVDENYIRDNSLYADKLIDVSNDIITYNLIGEIKEKNNKK